MNKVYQRATALFVFLLATTLVSLGQHEIRQANFSIPLRFGNNGASDLPLSHTLLDLRDVDQLSQSLLARDGGTITLPVGAKKIASTFTMRATSVMEPGLAAKYPDIKTFVGYNPSSPNEMISLTFSDSGLWGTVQALEGNYYIEPNRNNRNESIIFRSKDDPRKGATNNKDWCKVDDPAGEQFMKKISIDLENNHGGHARMAAGDAHRPTGDTILIYRMAMVMGAEATQTIAGGVKSVALTWMVNLVNTSNNVLIRDVALKLVLIANNDVIIFTSASTLPLPTQPYTPASYPAGQQPFPSPPYAPTTTLLDYCMPTLSAYIGIANFDAGYIHNNGIGGGWANVGALHSTDKGRGIGNPDYEIFIHEFGHMGGSPHNITTEGGIRTTFGGTIMGNRGNTRSPNGDQYSSHTIDRFTIGCYSSTANASQRNPSGNSIPSITVPASGFYIPKLTPFKLTGVGSDPDAGQTLTYSWEQNDSSSVSFSEPNFPAGTGPLFWSVLPSTNPTRYFPDLSFLSTNTTSNGEHLPFAARILNFRCIVRDNFGTCGGLNFKNVRFNVDGNSGPFEVTWANTPGTVVSGNTTQTITWNPNNTQIAPVNCSTVKVYLSLDGGLTYPNLLGTFPNNGSANVFIPNNVGLTNRIMVEAVGNIFFDINNANFQIADANIAGLNTQISVTEKVIHSQTSTSLDVTCQKLGSFTGSVVLTLSGIPAGATATFPNGQSTITLLPDFTTTLTFSNLSSVAKGAYPITITTTGGSIVKTNEFNLIKTGTAQTTPGNALSFTGDGYGTVANFDNPSSNVTLSAWIKRPTATWSDLEGIAFFPDSPHPPAGSQPGFFLSANTGELRYHAKWWVGSNLFLTPDEWTFVAIVVTPTTATFYKNGVASMISIENTGAAPFSGVMNVGSQTGSNRFFKGEIDEMKIWKRALTIDEIREQMHLTSPESAVDADLFSYYQFNQSTGEAVDVIRSKDMDLFGNSSPSYATSGAAVGAGFVSTKAVTTAGTTTFTSPINTGLDINFGTSPAGNIVVTNLTNITPNGASASSSSLSPGYWIVNNYGTVNTGLNAQMTFSMPTAWMNPDVNNYQLYKRTSTSTNAWEAPITASSVDVPNNKVSFSGVQSFSQFVMSSANALPVELLNFNVDLVSPQKALLKWTTASEFNSAWFNVERSQDGRNFTTIGQVKASGFSLNEVSYTFEDPSLEKGTYFYRLEMVDIDNSAEFSPIVSVHIEGKNYVVAAPNPNQGAFTLRISEDWQSVSIYNSIGQLIQTTNNQNSDSTLDIDLSQNSTGTYLISVLMKSGTLISQKVMVK